MLKIEMSKISVYVLLLVAKFASKKFEKYVNVSSVLICYISTFVGVILFMNHYFKNEFLFRT